MKVSVEEDSIFHNYSVPYKRQCRSFQNLLLSQKIFADARFQFLQTSLQFACYQWLYIYYKGSYGIVYSTAQDLAAKRKVGCLM